MRWIVFAGFIFLLRDNENDLLVWLESLFSDVFILNYYYFKY